MWYLFQLAVTLAVGLVSVHYDWQHAGGYDHGIAPAVIMVGAAWLATWLLTQISRLLRR